MRGVGKKELFGISPPCCPYTEELGHSTNILKHKVHQLRPKRSLQSQLLLLLLSTNWNISLIIKPTWDFYSHLLGNLDILLWEDLSQTFPSVPGSQQAVGYRRQEGPGLGCISGCHQKVEASSFLFSAKLFDDIMQLIAGTTKEMFLELE